MQLSLLECVQLGIRLEYGLCLEIPDSEIGQWQTLADVLACVRRQLPAQPDCLPATRLPLP
ncbi:hypothetical protein GCM10027422_00690 [Hymenobacter arcticus]